MTSPALLLTFGSFVVAIAVVGALYRDKEVAPFLIGASGILAMILGVTLLADPIAYSIGTDVLRTLTGYTISPNTTPLSAVLNGSIGTVVAVAGMGALLGAFTLHRNTNSTA